VYRRAPSWDARKEMTDTNCAVGAVGAGFASAAENSDLTGMEPACFFLPSAPVSEPSYCTALLRGGVHDERQIRDGDVWRTGDNTPARWTPSRSWAGCWRECAQRRQRTDWPVLAAASKSVDRPQKCLYELRNEPRPLASLLAEDVGPALCDTGRGRHCRSCFRRVVLAHVCIQVRSKA